MHATVTCFATKDLPPFCHPPPLLSQLTSSTQLIMSSPPHSSPPINGSGELYVGLNSSGNLDGTNLPNSNYTTTTTINTPNNPTTTTTTNNNIGKGSSIAADGDLLYEETRKGVRESASIMEFMKKRVKIEEDYARALLQLCKSFPMGSKYELPTNLFIFYIYFSVFSLY